MKRWWTWRRLWPALLVSITGTTLAVIVNLATGDGAGRLVQGAVVVVTLVSALLLAWSNHDGDPAVQAAQEAKALRVRQEGEGLRQKQILERVFRDPGWAVTLAALYDDPSASGPRFPLLSLGGQKFPIWVWQAEPSGDLDTPITKPLDRTLVPPNDSYASWYDPAAKPRNEYAALTRSANIQAQFNGPCYAFRRMVEKDGGYSIEAGPSWYFDSLVTSEALDEELVLALRSGYEQPLSLDHLPRRRWVHESTPLSPIVDGSTRGAALSVSGTMIIAEHDGGHALWLTRRSLEVATHPSFYHSTPAGILAPLESAMGTRTFERDFSVRQSLLREYAEELFDYRSLERGRLEDGRLLTAHNLEEGNPRVRSLLDATDAGHAFLRFVGISVNLLTLRPEVHVLIFVRSADWWHEEVGRAERDGHRLAFNWESRDGPFEPLPLGPNLELPNDSTILHPSMIVPNAAAGIALALPAARQLMNGGPLEPL